ncbi:MAG: tRNA uridine-5-carboxymethylaminomethyl(34) synthesis GTPase MnmE [Hyphomicrobiales bacterium]|nr:tRNA uridine-5-carboxymethylaminomethyl(34) synthesis GTPase MnmE [Hyphomicrobiales bacterium]
MQQAPPSRFTRDTIFAPASGGARAAIAVIRISGPACAQALDALAPGAPLADRLATLRALRDPATGEILDRALILRFAAPRSFTGEEMAEMQVTGGRAVVAGVLAALGKIAGLRPAEPGEFAWRAFENGKLDLAEVEGLADLVEAETAAQRRQAQRIAGGALSRESEAIRAKLVEAMAMLEAQIDFSDVEDADALSLDSARALARVAADRLRAALAGAAAAARLRDGFNVVIAGAPNVGKSTLMNALARRDVSIVSAIPGTTRDLVEIPLDLRGFPVTLVDTAGIRETDDPIEREGVARARRRAEEADLTLWLSDEPRSRDEPTPQGPSLLVITKADRAPDETTEAPLGAIRISALTGEGLPQLLDAIADVAEEQMGGREPSLIAQERHRLAFADALVALERVLDPTAEEIELVAEDLRLAARALERIAGRIDVEEVLGDIFSRLCVGK